MKSSEFEPNKLERTVDEQLTISSQVLPMDRHRDSVMEKVNANETVIVVGETGSGKTTRMPIYLMEKYPNKKIAITSPRVLPAISVSEYVAKQKGCQIGEEIGVITRDTKEVSNKTQVTFMTDGILLSMLRNDPMLLELDVVMVDEAHERSLNIDFSLGLLKRAQKLRKEKGESELKIVVASATIEEEKFANYFEESPVAKVEGRLFPVDLEYIEVGDHVDYTEEAGLLAKRIIDKGEDGDILIFMPGEEEINKTIDFINKFVSSDDAEVLPLFGAMNPKDQKKIFIKNGKRKIIVSTNIAETSVTIDGVKHVIDSGFLKQKEYNPETGIDALSLTKASKANLNQRMGRAGRTAPGKCYRLISKEEFESREDFQKPEIQRFDLGEVVLKMKDMGIKDVEGFDFVDNPSKERLHDAVTNLQKLEALDKNGDITAIGREMVRLQLRPDLARMLIEAKHVGCLEEMIDICAMMSASKQVFIRPRKTDNPNEHAENMRKLGNQDNLRVGDSDVLTLLNVWKQWEESNYSMSFAFDHLLNVKALKEVGLTRMQLLRALGEVGSSAENMEGELDKTKIVKCLLVGMPDSIFYSNDNGYHYDPTADLPYLEGTQIFPGSSLFKRGGKLILAMNINKSEKEISNGYGGKFTKTAIYARTCHKISLEELKAVAPSLVEEKLSGLPVRSMGSSYQNYNILINGKIVWQDFRKIEDFISYQDIYVLLPNIYRSNEEAVREFNNLSARSGGEFSRLDYDFINKFYQNVINDNNIKTDEDVTSHEDLFSFNLNGYISEEKIKEIENDSPEKMSFGDRVYKVNYQEIGYLSPYAYINLENKEDVETVLEYDFPIFPRMKRFFFRFDFKEFDNLNSLRKCLEEGRNRKVYSEYDDDNYIPYSKETSRTTLADAFKVKNEKNNSNGNGGNKPAAEIKPKQEQKPIEKEVMTPERKTEFLLSLEDVKLILSNLKGVINGLPERKDDEKKAKQKYLDRLKEINSNCNGLLKKLNENVESDVERIDGIISDFKNSIKVLVKNLTENKNLADKFMSSFTHVQKELIKSAKSNDVEIDDVLRDKISKTAFDIAFKEGRLITKDEADEIMIDLV